MFIFISLLVLAAAIAKPQGIAEDFLKAEMDCIPKFSSITPEMLQEMKQNRKFPDNPTNDFKCFLFCVAKTLELMNQKGELHLENLKTFTIHLTDGEASHDDAHAIVTKCIGTEHEESCEKAWQYATCKVNELIPYKISKSFCPTCNY